MKTSTINKSICVPIAALFLAGAFVVPARAENPKSLNGSLQGHETDVFQGPPPGTLAVDGTTTGIATHLGQFTLNYKLTVTLPEGTSIGSAVLVAANGDSIFANLVGLGVPAETQGLNKIVEINTIVGGTGRFANVKGSFTVNRLVNLDTGVTSGTIQGTLSYSGAGH
jgi:hypothetical protein